MPSDLPIDIQAFHMNQDIEVQMLDASCVSLVADGQLYIWVYESGRWVNT